MQMKRLTFSDEEVMELTKLLEERKEVDIICTPQISGIWSHNENWETELRLLLLYPYRVTVSRVWFIHKRQGIMIEALDFLIRFCRKHGIQNICIQSVETQEMAAFCVKNGFTPDPNASFESRFGFSAGDYLLSID